MLTCYFGVPGCGKTTLLTKFAVKELKKIAKGKSKYKEVYTNFYCLGAKEIDFDVFKRYAICDSLIVIDDINMYADNLDFFIFLIHLGNDIIYSTHSYELVDKRIRQLTQEFWYMSKSVIPLFRQFTSVKLIYPEFNTN